MEQSTLTSKGQTTIPASVRERLGLQPGDRILYDERDGEYVIRVHPGVAAVSGMFRHKVTEPFDGDFAAEEAAAEKTWVEEAVAEDADATPEPA